MKHDPGPRPEAPEFHPYVPPGEKVPEFTVTAIVLGFILSIVFNAANAYLGLKIGMTVSASIPSSIISMGVLRMILPRLIGRGGTILENNVVHTIASTGESIAAAIIFTIPALYFLGGEVTNPRVFLLGAAGGLLGILMMIPLRQSLVVQEHKALPFPEGTACAEVLIAGDRGGASAAPVFWGIGAGAAFKFAMSGLTLFRDTLMWSFPKLHQAGFGYEVSPLFVGVGYLVGLRIAAVMFAGGILGYWVLIPLIHALGGHNIVAPGTAPIDEMTTGQLRSTYVRYIGAGGVAFGGLVSLLKSLPDIASSLRSSLKALARTRAADAGEPAAEKDAESRPALWAGALLGLVTGAFAWDAPWLLGSEDLPTALRFLMGAGAHLVLAGGLGAALATVLTYLALRSTLPLGSRVPRTEHDLSLTVVGAGTVGMFLLLWLTPAFGLSFLEAAMVVLFCFFFVAVSARMVGLIGTTNQPVSGMTITALLTLTLLFAVTGHDPETLKSTAIMAGAVVCIAISLSGDMSQDLKTAALVGGTPWKVQLGEVMGTVISAARTGFILILLAAAYGIGAPTAEHPHPLEAPQSQLMASLVQGATGGNLPWTMLLTGAGIGLVAELCGVSALALSIGLYLPITNWPMILLGGALAWWVSRAKGGADKEHNPGSLFASGLIAGDALTGLALAGVTVAGLAGSIILRHPGDEETAVLVPTLFDQLVYALAGGAGPGRELFEGLLSTGLYAVIAFALYRFATSRRKPIAAG